MVRTIPEKENLSIEFKSDIEGFNENDLVAEIVGMTNTEGGYLYLGVEDDGSITGLSEKHRDPIGLMALVANKTVPSVAVRAEILEETGNEVMQIAIPMSRTIVATSDGKIQRRRLKADGTPENVPMYPFEIPNRLSTLNMLDFSAQILEGATIDDLDERERVRLRNIIRYRKGDNSLLELNDMELDKALRIVTEDSSGIHPTVTGMLLIGKEERLEELMPTAKAMFQVLEGTKIRKNEQLSKPLLATFELFEEYIKAWNPEREMEYGLFRVPIPEFSEAALREGLVNAFCHRDYTILQSVRVAIEDEGLTISSPGGFVEGVNIKNLLTVEPHGRNQTLADALKRIGLAEKTGRGIDRIFEGSIVYGRPLPDYSESTSTYVKLFIQRAEPDLQFTKMISNEENRLGRSLPINSLLILSCLQSHRRLDINSISNVVNISESRTKQNIEKLVEAGLVEAVGSNRSREYILSAKVYKEQDNVVGYIRQTGIDSLKYEELIVELATRQNGFVSRENVVDLLNVTQPQAYRLLKKLVKKERLEMVGAGRKARYRLIK
ncbi:ATP-dependent DNA helicase RecG [Pseudobutyrivibrio sp. YE44]|uniref:ATP-binding protein n=1 Tax=Pseudobutyrivibrio sp. YE44 TaxID=1520802 RepID=UPI00088A757A|nr:RNA-binding domain-containing protein [Pseudobutyrivibrio sp. YE44]SDB54298.1 ATP-dependent DNA helicase RecG [Pseudobutyrivibrio sp. YE44]